MQASRARLDLLRLGSGLLGLFAGLAAGPARAQAAPETFFPQIDARVVYVASTAKGGPPMGRLTLSWHVASGTLRVDIDQPERHWLLLRRDAPGVVMAMTPGRNRTQRLSGRDAGGLFPFLRRDLTLSPAGTGEVAGQSCALWTLQPPRGPAASACITDQGVPLRMDFGASGGFFEAASVSLEPQPAADFQVPAGMPTQEP